MNVLIVLCVLGAALLIVSVLLKHVALRGLSVSRCFALPAVFAGDEGELIETVINDRPMIIPWLRVESRIPAPIKLGRSDNLDVSGDLYHTSLFTVLPYQRITRHHRVRFARRGVYDVGNAALTVGDVTGLISATREQKMHASVIVYPRPADEHNLPDPLLRMTGEAAVRRRLLSDPFLVRGLRPYHPGDPVRDIHWPATARSGSVQLKVHDDTAALRLMVIINGQLRENQWDQVSDWEEEAVEQALSFAAALCLRALRSGMEAGFATNLTAPDGKYAVELPQGGENRAEALLTAFARLKLKRTLTFPSFLAALNLPRGTDLIVLSSYGSDEIDRQLSRFKKLGCTVMTHIMKGGAS